MSAKELDEISGCEQISSGNDSDLSLWRNLFQSLVQGCSAHSKKMGRNGLVPSRTTQSLEDEQLVDSLQGRQALESRKGIWLSIARVA
jgi:hypothetical protein